MDKQKFDKLFHLSPTIEKDGKVSFVLRKNYSDGNDFFSFVLHEPPKWLIEPIKNTEQIYVITERIKDILYNMYVRIYE